MRSTLTPVARRLRQDDNQAEAQLWGRLRGRRLNGLKFRRQHPIGPFVADFACEAAKLVVELDGSQHGPQTADPERAEMIKGFGYRILRLPTGLVLSDMASVLETILAAATDPRLDFRPWHQGGSGSHW